ncbi:30S ribosomal protein S15 [bacterium]|nr:30S ribosomal protein S15 [bacterium]|tara:strand:- start:1061 stop:1411 length:351 start_codon:yes stop_codon:yes gene_type:complete
MLSKKVKENLIKKYKTHDSDTGSSEVQIAILTEEIKQLTKHLRTHKHDFSSRRGLLRKVAERRRLLHYLRRENPNSFEELAKNLKIKVALLGTIVEEEEPTDEELKALEAKEKSKK